MAHGNIINKKGSVRDIGLMAVSIFAIALISFVLIFVYNSASNVMLQSDMINNTPAGDVISEHQNTMNRLDYITFALLLGFFIAIVITGFIVGGHPIFSILYLIFLIVFGTVSALLEYVWGTITTMTVFGTTLTALPLTNFIVGNLTLFVVIAGFLGVIVMYVSGQRVVQ